MRRVRDARHQLAELLVQRRRLAVQLGDQLTHLADPLLHVRRIAAGLLQLADFLRFGIALRLQFFRFRQRRPPLAIQLAERFHVHGESAIRQPRGNGAEIVAKVSEIVHGW